jgi:hypothetical protein
MAELVCPNCGKPNLISRESCQYCQASLMPSNEALEEALGQSAEQSGLPAEELDWLESMRQRESGRSAGASGLFLPDEDAEGEAELDLGADLPEWLGNLENKPEPGQPGEDIPPRPALAGETAPADQPAWLQRIRQRREADQTEVPSEDDRESGELNLESEDEVPDWLAGLVDGVRRTAKPEPTPEWLQEVPAGPEGQPSVSSSDWAGEEPLIAIPPLPIPARLDEARSEPEPEVVPSPPDLPEWLAEFSAPAPASEPTETTEQPPLTPPTSAPPQSEGEPSFDWLADLTSSDTITIEPAQKEQVSPQLPGETAQAFEWLTGLGESLPTAPGAVSSDQPPKTPSVVPESAFDWLASFSVPDEAAEAGAEAGRPKKVKPLEEDEDTDLFPADVPEWLSRAMQLQEQAPETGEAETGEPGIVPAALPSWLEAMRPVVDVAARKPEAEDATQARVERAGPLAGLRGVLPAEPEITRVRKPPIYSVKLQVSDTQQTNAELLKRMVETEGDTKPLPRRASLASQHLLRLGVAVVLLAALLWPVFARTEQAPLPALPLESERFGQVINQIPAQTRVLVAFDYEPGFTGEMDAIASAVMDHLMLRGAYLTIVSSIPAGPIVAERFIEQTQAGHHYERGKQYINLGYLPGGPSGMVSFAESPQRTLPYTLEGEPAWERAGNPALPPLQGIHQLADFGLMLVIVDNPDTARAWIEQVQPHLRQGDRQTPFLMVISAQAEPLVQPYFAAEQPQVQGMVVGLRGGAAYAHWIGRGDLPRRYWDAFGLGLPVAALLIALGSLINSLAGKLNPRRRQRKAADQPAEGEAGA